MPVNHSTIAVHPDSLATHELQSGGSLLLVRPASFGFNAETAASNAFQQAPAAAAAELQARAAREFNALVAALRAAGVRCCVVADEAPPARPDALFPNNWCSWHADGTLVLYPLLAPSRRLERREAIIEAVCGATGFRIRRRIDLTAHETAGRFLEGTGSLVLDRTQRVAYACRSPRTDAGLVRDWCEAMGYRPMLFDATDAQGGAYYHTNVILWIGSRCAAVCLEAIAPAQREAVRATLAETHELIELDRAAVARFAGNMLEVRSAAGSGSAAPQLLMSAAARAALSAAQCAQLAAHYDGFIVADVPTIESVGGGSVRCMVAEVPDVVAD